MLERSIAALEGATSVRGLNDLAVAFAIRGERTGDVRDLLRSLEALDRALETEPNAALLRFNHAVIAGALGLAGEAAKDWDVAVATEADSGWLREAHLRRWRAVQDANRLQVPVAREIDAAAKRGDADVLLKLARQHGPEFQAALARTLGSWDEKDAPGLARAGQLAEAIRWAHGEVLWRDAHATILDAEAAEDTALLAAHVAGMRAYGVAQQAVVDRRIEDASARFEAALARLDAVGSPIAAWAAFGLGLSAYQRRDPRAAHAAFDGAESRIEGRQAPILRGRIAWMRALLALYDDRPALAVARYNTAASEFTVADDQDNQAAVALRLAFTLDRLGQYREGWSQRAKALAWLSNMQPRRAHALLADLAQAVQRDLGARMALRFHDEAVRRARLDADAELWAQALIARGHARLNDDPRSARDDLDNARRIAVPVIDPGLRQRIAARARRLEVELALTDDAATARVLTEDSIQEHDAVAFRFEQGYEQLLRGRAALRLGNLDDAERALEHAISIAEVGRAAIVDRAFRRTFLDRTHTLLREVTAFHARTGDPWAALAVAERGRARQLLERRSTGEPWDSGQLRSLPARLPPATVVVSFLMLDSRLLIWTLGRSGLELTEASVTPSELTDLAQRVVHAARGTNQTTEPLEDASRLHGLLFGPIRHRWSSAERLVIVADGPLHTVPFAYLFDAETGRHVVEDLEIVHAPSVSVYGLGVERAPRRIGHGSRALVVGDPAFDTSVFPDLGRLDGAANEARIVASHLGVAAVLGADATPSRVLATIRAAEIVHLAVHGRPNAREPSLASLILAADPGTSTSGAIYARDLESLELPETCLVFLSACSSGGGSTSVSEGVLSLARPFLLAGSDHVISTRWRIPDESTVRFVDDFYQALVGESDPVRALRVAQLEGLALSRVDERSSAEWAAFHVLVGISQAIANRR